MFAVQTFQRAFVLGCKFGEMNFSSSARNNSLIDSFHGWLQSTETEQLSQGKPKENLNERRAKLFTVAGGQSKENVIFLSRVISGRDAKDFLESGEIRANIIGNQKHYPDPNLAVCTSDKGLVKAVQEKGIMSLNATYWFPTSAVDWNDKPREWLLTTCGGGAINGENPRVIHAAVDATKHAIFRERGNPNSYVVLSDANRLQIDPGSVKVQELPKK